MKFNWIERGEGELLCLETGARVVLSELPGYHPHVAHYAPGISPEIGGPGTKIGEACEWLAFKDRLLPKRRAKK